MQLSVADVRARALQIHQLMQTMMKENVHYGVIRGCKTPSLYKPGSEMLLMMFRISVDPLVEDLSDSEHIRYRVRCRGVALDGSVVGVGVGECSTAEEKYAYRRAVCDEEFDQTDPIRQRIKWRRDGGKAYSEKQVRVNPSDLANTILKMAKKRAQIDMCLTVLGASDIFSQDLEDLSDDLASRVSEDREPIRQPQPKKESAAPTTTAPEQVEAAGEDLTPPAGVADDLPQVVGVITYVKETPGSNEKKSWTRYGVKVGGEWFNTFDTKLGETAKQARKEQTPQIIRYRKGEHGADIVSIEPAPAQ